MLDIQCGACDRPIEAGHQYDNRHWSADGVTEYHAECCNECDKEDN
jgi:hypothetical protein